MPRKTKAADAFDGPPGWFVANFLLQFRLRCEPRNHSGMIDETIDWYSQS